MTYVATPEERLRVFRRGLIRQHLSADEEVVRKLMAYGELPQRRIGITRLPIRDDRSSDRWIKYLDTPAATDAHGSLLDVFIELDFPIGPHVQDTAEYQRARKSGLRYSRPDASRQHFDLSLVQFKLLDTPVGCLPCLFFTSRENFEEFIRAIAHHNAPWAVPRSMGALLVNGYNNWTHLNSLKTAFFAAHPESLPEQWSAEFKRITAEPGSYKEALAILSAGPYSGLTAAQVGASDEEWSRVSSAIRMWHEGTHYLTKRTLGDMRRHLIDELVADVAGVIQATGEIKRDWLRAFYGCGEIGGAIPAGRLGNYLDEEYSHSKLFLLFQLLMERAIDSIAGHFVNHPVLYEKENRIAYLLLTSILPLETLALAPEVDQLPEQAQRLAALLFSEKGITSECDRCFFRAEKEPQVSFHW